jgi:FMN phosphatase YigB (HAD superfamily)
LPLSQEAFVKAYFSELAEFLSKEGFDAKAATGAVWAGTAAMLKNDGARLNHDCFWDAFISIMSIPAKRQAETERLTDSFYRNEFNRVKSIIKPCSAPKEIIAGLKAKNYTLILATNPLFPRCAVESRLNWIGLSPEDFALISSYDNSHYCKPNPGYYREIFELSGKNPEHCLMVGNNVKEDMSAAALGTQTFLVTDFLENEEGADIRRYKNGSLEDFNAYARSLPAIKASATSPIPPR